MRNFAPCLALTALLAGCLPGTSFNVTLRLEGEDGKPIPDAQVLAGAYLTVAPPLEPPYDRPMAAVRGITDAKGIVRLSRVDGFYVGETPQDPLWKMLESRKPKIERSVIGVEGGSILVFAPGYGLVEQPFGSEDNAAFQARRARVGDLEVPHYYSWFRTGDEHEWFKPMALLHTRDFVKGKTLTIKLAKPRDAQFSLKSFSTRVLVRSAIATSTLTGTTEDEKARIYEFFRSQTAYAASISTNPFYAEQLDEFDNPKFRRWFMTQDISRAGAGTLVNVWMTEKALGLLPHAYDEVKRYVSAIQEGVRAEEETPRYWNHFYNPHDSKNSGPRGQTALQWAAIDNPDNPSNEWDWEDALRYYRSGDRAKAYKALGHVLHLLEDMSVPERTHLIDPDEGSSAFEEYFSIVAKRNFESLPWAYSVNAKVPIRVRGFREHFDVVAGLTFGPMKDGGKILDFDDYYQALPGASGKILRKPDEQTLGWMGEYLFPRTIEYAAGLMEHFYDTVQPRTAVKEGPVGANEQVAVARSSGTETDKFNKFTSGTDTDTPTHRHTSPLSLRPSSK